MARTKNSNVKVIGNVERLARTAGLSYGQMVAQMKDSGDSGEVFRKCKWCYKAAKKNSEFCSRACRSAYKAQEKIDLELAGKYRRRSGEVIDVSAGSAMLNRGKGDTCIFCGKPIPKGSNRFYYCSAECSVLARQFGVDPGNGKKKAGVKE
jgi:predicted nucleic acid-binding Zn ribbon protein